MFNAIARSGCALLLVWAASADAALMPQNNVNAQKWLQPREFINEGLDNSAAMCEASTGICQGSRKGQMVTSWSWATIPGLHALFTAFETEVEPSDALREAKPVVGQRQYQRIIFL